MARKKQRKKPYQPPQTRDPAGSTTPSPARVSGGISPASAVRRDRKEEARRQRDAIVRKMRRAQIIRRVAIYSALAAIVAGAILFYIVRSQAEQNTIDQAAEVARQAGCTQPVNKPDRGANHVDTGAIEYPEQPPTSGNHRTSPLPSGDRVYTEDDPADGTRAVHNLEHGYVVMWYRGGDEGALNTQAVEAVAAVAEGESEVILTPYDQLPEGVAFALTAWNRLQTCPAANGEGTPLSAEDARILAEAFILQFRNQTAPENAAA